MEINFFISLLLFRIIVSKIEYNLIDGIEKEITDIKQFQQYSFYIKISNANIIRFTYSTPFYYSGSLIRFYIFEYKNRNDTYSNKNSSVLLAPPKINNKYIYYISYNISSSLTNYVEFKYRSDNNFQNVTARIDILYEEYDLYNSKPLDLYNLYSNYSYSFFLQLFEIKTVNISIIINNMKKEPFSEVDIYEYESRNNYPSFGNIKKSISFEIRNNQLISSLSYKANFSSLSHYIAFKIKPFLDIDHIIITFENPFMIIDLKNNIWETMDNLIKNGIYLFFVEATQFAKVNINLIINNTENIPFEYISIYEYETKNNTYYTYISKKDIFINNENYIDFIHQFSYTVSSFEAKYLGFSFKINDNINHTLVKIDVSGGSYELFPNEVQNLTNFRIENDYFFFIEAKQYDIINMILSLKYQTIEPFSYIYYDELYERQQYNYNVKNISSISSNINNNNLFVTVTQNISHASTKYILFKIRPSYNIDYMLAKINIDECLITQTKYIYNLKSNISYYFEVSPVYTEGDLILTVYNANKVHFDFPNVYDCFGNVDTFTTCQKKSSIKILKNKKQKNEKGYTIEINAYYDKYYGGDYYIYIEMKSKYDINRMLAFYDYKKKKTIDYNLTLSMIIPVIIIILILLFYLLKNIKGYQKSKSLLNPINQSEFKE